MTSPVEKNSDRMRIHVGASRLDMAQQAASDVAAELRRRLEQQHGVRMIFAAAPSQREMLEILASQPGVDWTRVTAFHMDEYLGLPRDAPQRFGLWLQRTIFCRLPFGDVQLLEPGDDPATTAREYAGKLNEREIDLVCLGIGVNGHLAFNDPPADLHDPADVKVVRLDHACRKQQVDDRCFQRLNEVPEYALTLTIPRLLRSHRLYCCVPGASKREAVRRTLQDPIGPDCPATALRLHPECNLYLDRESAPDDLRSADFA